MSEKDLQKNNRGSSGKDPQSTNNKRALPSDSKNATIGKVSDTKVRGPQSSSDNEQKSDDSSEKKEHKSLKDRKDDLKKPSNIGKAIALNATKKTTKTMAKVSLARNSLAGIKAAISKAVAGASKFAGKAVAAIKSGWVAATSAIGGALNVTTTVATVVLSSTVGIGCAAVIGVGAVLFSDSDITKYGRIIDENGCEVDVNIFEGSMIDTSQTESENVSKIYSVFSEYDMTINQIAGIVGNFSVESGVNPVRIEGISGNGSVYTTEMQKIMAASSSGEYDNFDTYTAIDLMNKYTNYNIKSSNGKKHSVAAVDRKKKKNIDSQAYLASDEMYYAGLGLGQWTGGRSKGLLDYASSHELEWYSMDAQIGYMIGPDKSRLDLYTSAVESDSSIADCTKLFLNKWEGNSTDKVENRVSRAEALATEMAAMEVDVNYAQSVIAAAGATGTGSAAKEIANNSKCNSKLNDALDNSTLASTIVSYAHKDEESSKGNNGTELYQKLHDLAFPNDEHYMSCDRSVATAIVCSGADKDYLRGDVEAQLGYLTSKAAESKWKEVKDWGGNPENLQPGDVLIRKDEAANVSHTVMYVGNEAIKKVYPDAPDDFVIVSGSKGERSPGCGKFYTTEGTGLQTYRAFRYIGSYSDDKLAPPETN